MLSILFFLKKHDKTIRGTTKRSDIYPVSLSHLLVFDLVGRIFHTARDKRKKTETETKENERIPVSSFFLVPLTVPSSTTEPVFFGHEDKHRSYVSSTPVKSSPMFIPIPSLP